MKKITCLTALLIAASFNASADSFDNLIKDANSRLSFVEASGTCNVSYDEMNQIVSQLLQNVLLVQKYFRCQNVLLQQESTMNTI